MYRFQEFMWHTTVMLGISCNRSCHSVTLQTLLSNHSRLPLFLLLFSCFHHSAPSLYKQGTRCHILAYITCVNIYTKIIIKAVASDCVPNPLQSDHMSSLCNSFHSTWYCSILQYQVTVVRWKVWHSQFSPTGAQYSWFALAWLTDGHRSPDSK